MRAPSSISRLASLLLLSMCGCTLDDLMSGAGANFSSVSVTLVQEDSSGVAGTGLGFFNHGDAQVALTFVLTGVAVGQQYTGHVHRGTCSQIGPVVATLPVTTGVAQQGGAPTAETTHAVAVNYATTGHLVDFHTTTSGVDRRVSCGAFVS